MSVAPDSSLNDDAIEATAAAWLVEREEGFTADQWEAFHAWLAADPRHAAALARLEATHRWLTQLPRLGSEPDLSRRLDALIKPRAAPILRFPGSRLLAAAAAVVVATALWWTLPSGNFEQNFATHEGGNARVTLPDASFVELNGQSRVAVKFTPRQRDVALMSGEARFSVAKDASRPFVVTAGKIRVRAVGTAFHVRLGEAGVEVVVTEGRVQVTRVRSDSADGEALSELVAGQRLEVPSIATLAPGPVRPVVAIPAPSPAPDEPRRLTFAGTPLAQVIDAFNQHNRIQLVLGDSELGDRPVGGTFQADQVEAFVRLLENSGEVTAEWTYNSTIVLRKGD